MQVSDHWNAPRLSKKERAEQLAAGQCFNCGKIDHFSWDCPTRPTIRSSRSKPLGASTFNIEQAIAENDSDEYIEVLDSLPVEAIFINSESETSELTDSLIEEDEYFWPIAEWREHYPYWNQSEISLRQRIGDCYATVASSILTLEQPYPGDERYESVKLRPEPTIPSEKERN